jgi:hypothetical protein
MPLGQPACRLGQRLSQRRDSERARSIHDSAHPFVQFDKNVKRLRTEQTRAGG